MGLLDLFRNPSKLSAQMAPVALALESPNQTSSLAKVVFAEYFAGEVGEVTRTAALQIPAVKKARDVLVALASGLLLREFEGDQATEQPWLSNTKTGISPWHRTAYIVDDLLFHDWSALAVERDGAGQITDAVHIPFDLWTADANSGKVLVENKPVPADQIVLIPGNGSGGILSAGADTIKGARAVQRAWVGRAQNPIPLLVLQQVTDDQLEDDEITEFIDAWASARLSPNGAVGFLDKRLKLEAIGTVSTDLFEEGRNAVVLDMARLTGVPASILDGSQSTATLTYSTSEGKRNEFLDYSLPMWLNPIEARLSLDDVSGPGRVIRFDKSSLTARDQSAITAPTKD